VQTIQILTLSPLMGRPVKGGKIFLDVGQADFDIGETANQAAWSRVHLTHER
jgi:hypothetical protein